MSNLSKIREVSPHKTTPRNARTRPYRRSYAPKRREPTRVTPDARTSTRRKRNAHGASEPTVASKRTSRHGNVENARLIRENRDGTVLVELTVWGLGERFTQTMRYSEWQAIS